MNSFPWFAALMVASTFVAALAYLWLQVRALLRNRHVSFLLLSIATVCGLLGFTMSSAGQFFQLPAQLAALLYYAGGLILIAQFVLGLWGTASLFRSYGELREAAKADVSAMTSAPNNRWRGP